MAGPSASRNPSSPSIPSSALGPSPAGTGTGFGAAPPTSTEQLIDPARYLAGEAPKPVPVPAAGLHQVANELWAGRVRKRNHLQQDRRNVGDGTAAGLAISGGQLAGGEGQLVRRPHELGVALR